MNKTVSTRDHRYKKSHPAQPLTQTHKLFGGQTGEHFNAVKHQWKTLILCLLEVIMASVYSLADTIKSPLL